MNTTSLFPVRAHRLTFGNTPSQSSRSSTGSNGPAHAERQGLSSAALTSSVAQPSQSPAPTAEAKGFFKTLRDRVTGVFTSKSPTPEAAPSRADSRPSSSEASVFGSQPPSEAGVKVGLVSDSEDEQTSAQSAKPRNASEKAKDIITALGNRIMRFIKDLGKAFTRLFRVNKPQSDFDAQFKALRQNFKQIFNEKDMDESLKYIGEQVEEEKDLLPDVRQAFEPLVVAFKTDATRKAWIEDNVTKGLEALNKALSVPENREECMKQVLFLPVRKAHVTRNLHNAFPGLVPQPMSQSCQGSSSSLHPKA